MDDYAGRVVVVAGAGGALGAGLAATFGQAGARVVGVDRAAPKAAAAVPGVAYESVDLIDDGQVGALFDRLGAPWAVVNTVGGFAPHTPLADLDIAELTRQLNMNLLTAAVLTKHALRVMQPVGTGRIVHTSSRAATDPTGSGFAYSVSKLAVLHLVAMAAAEVAGSAITVNAVVPSIIDTPANRAAMPGADVDAWPTIADLAPAYLFLASPSAGQVNGATLPV